MKLKYIYTFLFLLAMVTSCEDLENLNENPNQPEEVSSEVLLTAAIRSSVNSMVNESFLLGNNIAQLTTKTLRTEVDVYSWNSFPTVWESLYNAASDLEQVEQIATENNNDHMVAVAKVVKSWIFSTLTLAYGDIPYTEAIKGVESDNWFPAYDEQQSILNGSGSILDELETADALLNSEDGNIEGDILYDGDASKWQKLANSLRLRILLHLSNKTDVSADMADIIDNRPIMNSNSDNAVLEYTGTFPNEYPLVPLKQGDFDAVVMSQSAVDVMQAEDDPRLEVYARPTNITETATNPSITPLYDGGVNGLETGGCDKSGSRLGLKYYDYPGHPGINEKAGGVIMTWAEVEFIIAEAANKNLVSVSEADHYKNGIEASMQYHKVNYPEFGWTDFDDFYTNSGVAYDDALLTIWKQKWLALFFHGLEPYFEFRRWMFESDFAWSSIPFVSPPCQNTNNDQLPLRFLYPGNEQSLNPDNYSSAVEKLGENSQNAAMWLMQ